MSSRARRSVVILASVGVTTSGCASTVVGAPSPANGLRQDVADSDFSIVGSIDSEIDTTARNALADINDFWSQHFPDLYAADFPPLTGGYYSIDPDNFDPDDYPEDIGCLDGDPENVAGNAFYCFPQPGGDGDNIVYDRTLLESLAQDYGRFLPALVMAHEFGHAIQGREPPPSDLSIVYETQADCYAGAWTGWVAQDNAKHFNIRAPELDDVIRGFLLLRDEPGSAADDESAHGSYFDRVSAFQEGFDSGARACRDNYDDDRLFTLAEFTPEDGTSGNVSYQLAVEISDRTLEIFWESAFDQVGQQSFITPELVAFDGDAPECGGDAVERDISFCPDDNTVAFDESDLTRIVADEIGDFAVTTAISLPYALAARHALDRSVRGPEAISAAVCATGWFAAQFYLGTLDDPADTSISPGDIDEAVIFLIEYGSRREILPEVGLSGFQLVDVFRQGFINGGADCGIFD
ncbi:MAG: neutral zinc metallopeptidase [Actinomycetota bacterium]|nr:neutral zinc metallopeptidase [Actinomycetota bacterium]